jgi:hypothetical protein
MALSGNNSSFTNFLNVDLDIYARYDLRPLVNAFGKKVMVLYAGRERAGYSAHLELARMARSASADSIIRGFCSLIRGLPPSELALWNSARGRDFSIGVQAGMEPNSCDFALDAATVQAVADLRARIVFTVYAPEQKSARQP